MKISDLLQEAVYDIVGYILPGLLAIPFIILIINNNFNYSSIYSLYVDLNNFKLLLNSFNFPLTYYIPILIVSYIIGIFLKYFSILIGKLFYKIFNKTFKNSFLNFLFNNKFSNKIFDKDKCKNFLFYFKFTTKIDANSNANNVSTNLVSILIDNSNILLNKYDIRNHVNPSNDKLKELFNDTSFLKKYARTTSRFNNHNNLSQKYIAKTNLFSSLSALFLIEFLNAFISLVTYCVFSCISLHSYHAYEFNFIKILVPIIISAVLFILFIACYIEFKDHKNYQDEENFFYLLESYYKKDTQQSSS